MVLARPAAITTHGGNTRPALAASALLDGALAEQRADPGDGLVDEDVAIREVEGALDPAGFPQTPDRGRYATAAFTRGTARAAAALAERPSDSRAAQGSRARLARAARLRSAAWR